MGKKQVYLFTPVVGGVRHPAARLKQLHRKCVPLRLDDLVGGASSSFAELPPGFNCALSSSSAGQTQQVLVTFKQLDGEQPWRQASPVCQIWCKPGGQVRNHCFCIEMVARLRMM